MPEPLSAAVVASAPDVTPADVLDKEALLQELAALSLLDYDQRRVAAAEQLSVRVSTLDTEVAARRPHQGRGPWCRVADAVYRP
jgi:hypothetical protein